MMNSESEKIEKTKNLIEMLVLHGLNEYTNSKYGCALQDLRNREGTRGVVDIATVKRVLYRALERYQCISKHIDDGRELDFLLNWRSKK